MLQFANGDSMVLFGLGTWNVIPGNVYKAVIEAFHSGYRHIDCGSICDNEAAVGQTICQTS
jgi:alcohol dehydrogenase (NADP+)